jgi:hypothetical protein
MTVRDVARLARGGPAEDTPEWTVTSTFRYRHRLADYLAGDS